MKRVNKLGGRWMVVPAIKMKRWEAMRRDGERREDSTKGKDDEGEVGEKEEEERDERGRRGECWAEEELRSYCFSVPDLFRD